MTNLISLMQRNNFYDQLNNFEHKINMSPRYTSNGGHVSEVEDTETHFLISLDVPGFGVEDLNIELKENLLSIEGERKSPSVKAGETVSRHLHRKFTLPNTIDKEAIEADCQLGVLRIILPKQQPEAPQKIQVKTGSDNPLFEVTSA